MIDDLVDLKATLPRVVQRQPDIGGKLVVRFSRLVVISPLSCLSGAERRERLICLARSASFAFC